MNVYRMLRLFAAGTLLLLLAAAVGFSIDARNEPSKTTSAADARFTVILEGGTLYDGTGAAPYVADVGLRDDRVAAIGDLSEAEADRRLDISGLAVAPGFIDMHSHAAGASWNSSDIAKRPLAENYLRQGVTTAIGGQDGSSPLPIGDYLERLATTPTAINVGLFVGHGTIRSHVMGVVDRPPTDAELDRMRTHVRQAMEDGAFGLSSGLEYTPGAYADTEELIALARETAPYDGLYASHLRDEGGRLLESVDELIRIGEEAGVPAHVTHHKVIGPDRWGNSEESLRLIEEARVRGVDVTSDVYPYTAASTQLTILFPSWSREGGTATLNDRLENPEVRPRIRDAVTNHLNEERGGDPSTVVLARCSWNDALDGKSLAEVLEERDDTVAVEAAAELAMDLQARGGCDVVLHSMSDDDVRRIMQHPTTMIASDGRIPAPGVGMPHPRSYGTFARVLGHYVREEGVLSLREAIYKMTGFPARRLGLTKRGELREDAMADLVVFDPERITDHATFADPHQYASSVAHVFVSGEPVLLDGKVTGTKPGRVLRADRSKDS